MTMFTHRHGLARPFLVVRGRGPFAIALSWSIGLQPKAHLTDNTLPCADALEHLTALPIGDNLCLALARLLRAYECAADTLAAPWDFALEIRALYEVQLTTTDVRWLVVKELVKHGSEISVYGDAHRSFTRSDGFNFLATTCVILTNKGAAFARQILQASAAAAAGEPIAGAEKAGPLPKISPANGGAQPNVTLRPEWNSVRRELSLGSALVKRFQVPARNQESILTAFQEEGWPEHIDDPLTGALGLDLKNRLNDVIFRLNRNQIKPLIRFRTNGNGNGVRWSLSDLNAGAGVREPRRRRPLRDRC